MNRRAERGFSLLELLIVVTLVGVAGMVATTSYRSWRSSTILNRAARVVAADAAITRSYAIRERGNVSLVADETGRTWVIRNSAGTVLRVRGLDTGSDLPVSTLDVQTAGDSLTFNSRGLLTTAGTVQIAVGRDGGTRTVSVNTLGRTRVTNP